MVLDFKCSSAELDKVGCCKSFDWPFSHAELRRGKKDGHTHDWWDKSTLQLDKSA